MIKQRAYDINQTNIANIGSELDHKIKTAAAGKEPAWAKVGKDAGLFVWRVEKFQLHAVPEDTVGKFFDGDAYVVLHSVKNSSGQLIHSIFFWLGDECSQDEAGTAAYKTVELDDFLGGSPIQYREIHGSESNGFIALFTHFTVLHGGIESGFKHVSAATYAPRLLRIHGDRKHVYVQETALTGTSLNSGDVFVLDKGLTLIQWNGAKASGIERARAAQYVEGIKSERDGKPTIAVSTQGDSDLAEFWAALGGEVPINPPVTNETATRQKAIYELSDETGSLQFTQIATGKISRSALKSEDVFIVDSGVIVFAWVGSKTDALEKKNALGFAHTYVKDHNLPETTNIVRLIEGTEIAEFNQSFL